VTRPYAVAGADIEPGMTVILAPGEAPFVVRKVEPYPQANSWLLVFRDANRGTPVQKNAWFADMSDRAEFSTQVEEVSSDEARLELVTHGAPSGEGHPSGSPCHCGEVDGHTGQCSVIS
jgi:hypothetical protein